MDLTFRPESIRCLWWDLGNVLVNVDVNVGFRMLGDYLGVPWKQIAAGFPRELIDLYETSVLDTKGFFKAALDRCGLDIREVPLEQLEKMWRAMVTPNEPLINLARELTADFRTCLVSNINPIHHYQILHDFNFEHWNSCLVFSYVVGYLKPEARIYQEALAQSECAPGEVLFIDDRPVNLEGARRLGIQTWHHVDNATTIAALGVLRKNRSTTRQECA